MSRLKDLVLCSEYYRLKYWEGWRSRSRAPSLWFGNLVHTYLELYYKGDPDAQLKIQEEVDRVSAETTSQSDADKLLEISTLIFGIMETYPEWAAERDKHINVVAVEQELEFLGVKYRVDLLAEVLSGPNQGLWVLDHKTHGLGRTNYYSDQVQYDLQAQVYVAGMRARGMVYNLIGKPSIRQRQKESRSDFIRRLALEYRDPEKEYYQRLWFPMGDLTAEKVAREVEGRRRLYKSLVESGTEKPWPRNTAACYSYGSRCVFMELCSGCLNPEDYYDRKTEDVPVPTGEV